jgi:hypothetical protein
LHPLHPGPFGEHLTLWTVRFAMAALAASLAIRFTAGYVPLVRRLRLAAARFAWSVGCVLQVVHIAAALGFYHGWSHAEAYAHTARRTAEMTGCNWGGGLYLNYLFTALWMADAAWWQVDRESYENRGAALDAGVLGFMAFMAVNGVIVFGPPATRIVGIAITFPLLLVVVRARRLQRRQLPRRQ